MTDPSLCACRCSAPPAELDLRALPPPEPLQRALAAADALLPGESVRVLTPMLPTPLLEALATRGLSYRVEPFAHDGARVLIERPQRDGPPAD